MQSSLSNGTRQCSFGGPRRSVSQGTKHGPVKDRRTRQGAGRDAAEP